MNPSTSAPLVGTVLEDRYELVRLIARGGMGEVYEGRDRLLQRSVAVKAFRATAATERSRFDAEVTTLAALNHPGLVRVYDAGEHDGDGFVVLELVDGPNLRAILADRGALPPAEVAAIGAAVAVALAYVHAHGVVHRDVTPANVLCDAEGRPRLADFGIARLLDTSRVTTVASTVGTAAYMAPEQVQGLDVTPAADVYALGLVLLEALTGTPAFGGPSTESAIARLARDPDVVGAPAPWQPLLAQMTRRHPEERPTATAVADELRKLEGATVPAADGRGAEAVSSSGGTRDGSPVVGRGAVDAEALTEVVAAGSGTAVMPVLMRPESTTSSNDEQRSPTLDRRWLWAALVAMALALGVGLASASGDGDVTIPVPTPSTLAPVVATTAPPPSTTAAPPSTESPKGHDKGKGPKGGKDG